MSNLENSFYRAQTETPAIPHFWSKRLLRSTYFISTFVFLIGSYFTITQSYVVLNKKIMRGGRLLGGGIFLYVIGTSGATIDETRTFYESFLSFSTMHLYLINEPGLTLLVCVLM